jgi:hypothetical protein
MATAHLQGKRTGRPRGSKSLSPVQRGLVWASKHLGQNIEPPTPAAKFFVDMAREEPAKFVSAVAALDAANRQHAMAGTEVNALPAKGLEKPLESPQDAKRTGPDRATTYRGVEGNSGRKLSFEFRPNGTVVITIDDQHTFEGTWTEHGDQVTIELNGATFQGTIKGNTVSGTCRYHKSGRTWPFSVTRET